MILTTINVNGVRAAVRERSAENLGLLAWLSETSADVVCLQETRCDDEQLAEALAPAVADGWHVASACAHLKGRSGVAVLSRTPFSEVRIGVPASEFESHGRYVEADIGDVTEAQQVTTLGGGTVLTIKDGGMITDHRLRRQLIEVARANDLPWQFKRVPAGGTDARSIQLAGEGVRALAVAVPARYIHSPVSLIRASDYESTVTLLAKFLAQLATTEA